MTMGQDFWIVRKGSICLSSDRYLDRYLLLGGALQNMVGYGVTGLQSLTLFVPPVESTYGNRR